MDISEPVLNNEEKHGIFSVWRTLTFSQRISLVLILSFLILTPLSVVASYRDNRTASHASSVITPAVFPTRIPTITQAPETKSCVFPLEYWRKNPEKLPESVNAGGVKYLKEMIITLFVNNSQDVTRELLNQLIVAKINRSRGAESPDIDALIVRADKYLEQNKIGSIPKPKDKDEVIFLNNLLMRYNMGMLYQKSCGEGILKGEEDMTDASRSSNVTDSSSSASGVNTGSPAGLRK